MTPRSAPRWFRLLVALYPRDFRERYGNEYLEFLAQERHARRRGRLNATAYWGRAALQTVVNAAAHRVGRARGGPGPNGGARDNRGAGVADLWKDVQLAGRVARRDPLYSIVAIATLALGIGATTAIYTVVDQVLFRPLPYPEPGQLVHLSRIDGDTGPSSFSWPDFADLRDQTPGILMAAYSEHSSVFLEGGTPSRHQGARSHHALFSTLGVSPLLGRTFTPEEDRFDGPDLLILSHALWSTRFGGDPAVLGRSVELAEGPYTVVGVMPPGFSFPSPNVEYWAPLHEDELLVSAGLGRGIRTLNYLDAVGRVNPSASSDAVEDAMGLIAARVDDDAGLDRTWSVDLVPLQEYRVGDIGGSLLLFLWAAILVFGIACANVASVTLSRGVVRAREFAVRAALGAGRGHAVRQVLVESLLLALAGGGLGLVLATVFLDTVVALVPTAVLPVEAVGLDRRILAVTGGVAVLAALLAGILPALRAAGTDPGAVLSASGRGTGPGYGRQRVQRGLVVVQIAMSIVLLTSAGLLLRSFHALRSQHLGFEPAGVVTAQVELPEARYAEAEQRTGFYAELFDRIDAIPGVTSASATYSLPFAGNHLRVSVVKSDEPPEDDEDAPIARSVLVRPRYFETMSVPLLRGRDFTDADRFEEPHVAVVNQLMADRFWPGEDPIGKVFRYGGSMSGSMDSLDQELFNKDITVVGVAGVERRESLAEVVMPEFYRPYLQMPWWTMTLVLKTDAPVASIVPQLREAIAGIDATIPVDEVSTLGERVAESASESRLRSVLAGLFAAIAALLTMVGLYGVSSFSVSQRLHEIGIRIALGARGTQVRRRILRDGMQTTALGVLLGVPLAFGAARLVRSMLFSTSETDVATYGLVLALLVGTTFVATYLPARKASSVDPMEVIGAE